MRGVLRHTDAVVHRETVRQRATDRLKEIVLLRRRQRPSPHKRNLDQRPTSQRRHATTATTPLTATSRPAGRASANANRNARAALFT